MGMLTYRVADAKPIEAVKDQPQPARHRRHPARALGSWSACWHARRRSMAGGTARGKRSRDGESWEVSGAAATSLAQARHRRGARPGRTGDGASRAGASDAVPTETTRCWRRLCSTYASGGAAWPSALCASTVSAWTRWYAAERMGLSEDDVRQMFEDARQRRDEHPARQTRRPAAPARAASRDPFAASAPLSQSGKNTSRSCGWPACLPASEPATMHTPATTMPMTI